MTFDMSGILDRTASGSSRILPSRFKAATERDGSSTARKYIERHNARGKIKSLEASRKRVAATLLNKCSFRHKDGPSERPSPYQLLGEDSNGDYEFHYNDDNEFRYNDDNTFTRLNQSFPGAPAQYRSSATVDPGSCLQCGDNMPASELQERILELDGLEMGICAECYPEYLQILEDTAAETAEELVKQQIGSSSSARPRPITPATPEHEQDWWSWQDDEVLSGDSNVDGWEERASQLLHTRLRLVTELADDTQSELAEHTAPISTNRLTQTDCSICGEARGQMDFAPATADCSHDVTYCRTCLSSWITSSLDSRGWDNINCPEPSCGQMLSAADIDVHASAATREAYAAAATKAALSALPAFRWCLNPACGSGQIHEPSASPAADGTPDPIFTCHSCGFRACVVHAVAWHAGETCAEYDYRTDGALKAREEALTAVTVGTTTKPCPKCAARIEKRDGCDHMSCTRCRFEFCWLCSAEYAPIRDRGNSYHLRTCRHWRSR